MTGTGKLPAVIWVADDPEWERYAGQCTEWCRQAGHEIVAMVTGRSGGTYEDVLRMVMDGRAEVIVIATRDQLPAGRLPRVEVVAEERRRLIPQQRRHLQRPRFLRRD